MLGRPLLKRLATDRLSIRLLILTLIFMVWMVTYRIPKANGVDASVQAGLMVDYFSLVLLVLVSVILRKLILKSWSTPRSALKAFTLEIIFLIASEFAFHQVFSSMFSRTRAVEWELNFFSTKFAGAVALFHVCLFFLAQKSETLIQTPVSSAESSRNKR
jgi:hypothetical protein